MIGSQEFIKHRQLWQSMMPDWYFKRQSTAIYTIIRSNG